MADTSADAPRSLTVKVLDILGSFDDRHRRLTLSGVAERARLPVPTAHRILAQMVQWGALARFEGTYEIGSRIWDLGLLAPVQMELRQLASPFLHDLYAATQDTVHLAVRDGTRALYVDRLSGNASVAVVSQVGARLPLHTTGVGKALLAHSPPDVVDEVMGALTRVTAHSVVQPRLLARQLAEVRRRGYAYTAEEMSLGTASVAVPVLDGEGAVTIAIGIVAPSSRRDLVRVVPALQVAASGITRQLRRAADYSTGRNSGLARSRPSPVS